MSSCFSFTLKMDLIAVSESKNICLVRAELGCGNVEMCAS